MQVDRTENILKEANDLINCNRVPEAQRAYGLLQGIANSEARNSEFNRCMGNVLMLIDREAEAETFFLRAIEAEPNDLNALNGYSSFLIFSKRYQHAEQILQKILNASPNYSNALSNLALLLSLRGADTEIEKYYLKAIESDLSNFIVYQNLGLHYLNQNRLAEALETIRSGIKIEPESHSLRLNLSAIYLAQGEWMNAWPYYESRLPINGPTRLLEYAPWLGENLPEGTLLVLPEQGLGDMLLFARFILNAAERLAQVLVLCDAHWENPLLRLLSSSFKQVENVHVLDGSYKFPEFSVRCAIGSLPRIFSTHSRNVPYRNKPYLAPSAQSLKKWKHTLSADPSPALGAPRIGIVWKTGDRENVKYDNLSGLRSLTLEHFKPFSDSIPEANFYSLQLLGESEEKVKPPEGMRLIDHTAHIKDFEDTAALASCLDFFICVDTPVPNLCGALNKPTFLLKSFYPDWRWMNDERSPWYESVRVIRMRENNSTWESVIEEAKDSIVRYVDENEFKPEIS